MLFLRRDVSQTAKQKVFQTKELRAEVSTTGRKESQNNGFPACAFPTGKTSKGRKVQNSGNLPTHLVEVQSGITILQRCLYICIPSNWQYHS